ncbi:carbohydrate-binding domain-containing protein [Streptomyces sp. NRRL F-5193]|uniref:carbohydrate-binding domain-containing protein n=1 Tax=Streptomyces sp. NRRL F-5193 TaxID=1463860 RepID=UPI002D21CC1A|nr:carbohydrate-binding domain-containing protein [Streptomyces sp. NRRL F-5193]
MVLERQRQRRRVPRHGQRLRPGLPDRTYPYCAHGSASDPDGDGWGWENNRSCVVRGSAADR